MMNVQWGYHMMGGWMWIVWIIIAVVVVWLLLRLVQNTGTQSSQPGESARDVLDRRYASGEINKDEYDRIKQDLLK